MLKVGKLEKRRVVTIMQRSRVRDEEMGLKKDGEQNGMGGKRDPEGGDKGRIQGRIRSVFTGRNGGGCYDHVTMATAGF